MGIVAVAALAANAAGAPAGAAIKATCRTSSARASYCYGADLLVPCMKAWIPSRFQLYLAASGAVGGYAQVLSAPIE
jgi:hypothetical protein